MIAFVFPGQGAQKVGMGQSLATAFPVCRDVFAEADAALGESLSTMETVAGERSRYSARIFSVTGLPASDIFFFPVMVLQGNFIAKCATFVHLSAANAGT